jgi:ATP-binding protein involved in chromosome partitioning
MALNLAQRRPKDIVFANDLMVEWRDGSVTRYPFVALRDACPCAGCVEELTGRKTLDPKTIKPDIHIRTCEYIGNYAIRIDWSDGHNTGIYSFRFLRDLSELKGFGGATNA